MVWKIGPVNEYEAQSAIIIIIIIIIIILETLRETQTAS
jgi:hypothetical protein